MTPPRPTDERPPHPEPSDLWRSPCPCRECGLARLRRAHAAMGSARDDETADETADEWLRQRLAWAYRQAGLL